VPLDYANPDGEELAIALLKVPSNISTSGPTYRGSILLNPGGPGNSGVEFALSTGPLIQTTVGADFDIIGFDPRGKLSSGGS
jgi:pimeloyl-ACP methyl ester carboxylesterase